MMKDCHEVSQPWRQEVCLCAVRSPCRHRDRAHVRDKNGVMKDEFLPHPFVLPPFSCLSLSLSPIHSFMHLTRVGRGERFGRDERPNAEERGKEVGGGGRRKAKEGVEMGVAA